VGVSFEFLSGYVLVVPTSSTSEGSSRVVSTGLLVFFLIRCARTAAKVPISLEAGTGGLEFD